MKTLDCRQTKRPCTSRLWLSTLFSLVLIPPSTLFATSYYVNCSAATNGSGTQASPWNSLTSPNAQTFKPGDQMLFARGTTCKGSLTPQGSGNSAAPITLNAYGRGALPIINGSTSAAQTIYLNGVQYYDIEDLSIQGSTRNAIFVYGATANKTYNHYHFVNLDISAVNHVAKSRGDGLEPPTSITRGPRRGSVKNVRRGPRADLDPGEPRRSHRSALGRYGTSR
jgi:hypothetical protein